MSLYVKVGDLCDYCGELARRPRGVDVPGLWADGSVLRAKKTKSNGIECADCQWWKFEDFCASQGCSAANPVLHID